MATLPRHPASWSQRRAPSPPPPEPAAAEQDNPPRTNSFSAASIDSQTVLLNSPPTESSKPTEAISEDVSAQTVSQPAEGNEPRRCWICFNDETEDDENTSEWRSPCPCVLVAHEKCLLDWIADMEAPNSRRRTGRSAGKILCPQCKAEIKLQRPRSLAVQTVQGVERYAKLLVLPGIFTLLTTGVYYTLAFVGGDAVYKVFGIEDANTMLRVRAPPDFTYNLLSRLQYYRLNWKREFGLPAIPLALILSRTRLADSFLPFLPLVFFAGSGGVHRDTMSDLKWPPSAAFTVATLPYVRSIYNMYYDRYWAPYEARWLKEIQPRAEAAEDTDAEIARGEDDAEAILDAIAEEDAGVEDGDDVVELEVDVDLLFDWNAGGPADNNNAPENPPVPVARGPARPLDAPPVEDDAAPAAEAQENNNAAPAPEAPQPPAQPRRARVRRERNATFSTGSIAETTLGALLFPNIAAIMGEVLRLALPASWVAPPAAGKAAGFFQHKWARSIVGGCLFVGLKDAVLLYVRWKMAQAHRQRKVLDYDGSKGKKKKAT